MLKNDVIAPTQPRPRRDAFFPGLRSRHVGIIDRLRGKKRCSE